MLQSRVVKGRTGERDGGDRGLSSSRRNVLGEGCGRSAWRRRSHSGRITGRITRLHAAAGLYGRVNDRSAPLSAARRVVATAAAVATARDISPSPRERRSFVPPSLAFRSASHTPASYTTLSFVSGRDARTYISRETPIRLEARFSITSRLPLLRSRLSSAPLLPWRGPAVKRRYDPHLSTGRERMSIARTATEGWQGCNGRAPAPRRPGISSAAWWQPCRRLQL